LRVVLSIFEIGSIKRNAETRGGEGRKEIRSEARDRQVDARDMAGHSGAT
jgi:hypothetical protein